MTVALTDLRVLSVQKHTFAESLASRPKVHTALLEAALYRQRHADLQALHAGFPVDRRIGAVLLDLAHRYGVVNQDDPPPPARGMSTPSRFPSP